jgi:hypothetical protein
MFQETVSSYKARRRIEYNMLDMRFLSLRLGRASHMKYTCGSRSGKGKGRRFKVRQNALLTDKSTRNNKCREDRLQN